MKIGPCGFRMPVSNGYTALRREAVFKKSPTLPAPMLRRGFTLWVLPEAPRGGRLFRRGSPRSLPLIDNFYSDVLRAGSYRLSSFSHAICEKQVPMKSSNFVQTCATALLRICVEIA